MSDSGDEMRQLVFEDTRDKMHKAIGHLQDEFAGVRTGRATSGLVEKLEVEVYGAKTVLQQIASFSVPEPRLLVISPYDKTSIKAIEKAIQTSDLGINPSSDGRVIRLPIPPLNEARRKELVKQVSAKAEEARVAVRNVRRHAVDELRKMLKAGDVPEDDEHKAEEEVERLTHLHNDKIETVTKAKEREVMDV